MINYPLFAAALADVDINALAQASGTPAETIEAIAAGGVAPSLGVRMRLARALDANPLELFRLDDDLEAALADVEAQGHHRHIDDPATLRLLDRSAT